MTNNPFSASPRLTTPLRLETCQQIHGAALAAVVSAEEECGELPRSLDPIALRDRVRRLGGDAYLLHPTRIAELFAGVTLGVYLAIQELYCSRIERGIQTIWTIFNAMAQQAKADTLSYEAIWAICVFLQRQRMRMTSISIERMEVTWWLIFLPGEHDINGEDVFPSLVGVFDEMSHLILAFRAVTSLSLTEAVHLSLYDALLLHRYPSRGVPTALIWYLPERLVVDEALPWKQQNCCSRFGLRIERQCAPRFARIVRQQWMREVTTRGLKSRRWLSAFDSYLHKASGYSPHRLREERDQDFASLTGYTRDPGWSLPALRMLLPCRPATITPAGTIIYRGNVYRDDLLCYWPDTPVTIRASEPPAASLWVYLQGEVLCQAIAQAFRAPVPFDTAQRVREGAK